MYQENSLKMNRSTQHEKIGIGVLTFNRPALFRECISGIPEVDITVIVNDGDAYPATLYPSRINKVIQHKRNLGVGRSKNEALRFLLNAGCSDIFLCEDDMRIVEPNLCKEYVRAANRTGILHFNFAFHGPRNKSLTGIPVSRKIVDYGDGIRVSLNRHSVGALSYYRREVLIACGFIDPLFRNMLDHVDHTYRIIREGFHPPFWWFADLAESWRMIDDLDPDLAKSTMRYDKWSTLGSFHLSNLYFFLKYGSFVQNVPDSGEEEVDKVLRELERQIRTDDSPER